MELTSTNLYLIIGGVFIWLYWLWRRRDLYEFAFKIHNYWGLPLLGVMLHVRHMHNVLPYITKQLKRTNHRSACVWIGTKPLFFTQDPKVIEQICTQTDLLEKSSIIYNSIGDAMHGALVACPVKRWPLNRKVVAPLMRPKQLLNFIPIFNKYSKEFTKSLEYYVSMADRRNMLERLRDFAFKLSMETTMGYTKQNESEWESLSNDLFFMFQQYGLQIFLRFLRLDFIPNNSPKFLTAKKRINDLSNEVLKNNVKNLQSSDLSCSDENGKSKGNIFIEQALRHLNSGDMYWNEIVGNLNGIIAGTFETTSSTMFNIFCVLGMYPEIQDKLYEELKEIFPDKEFEVQHEDLNNLKYLDMIINESLRVFPPAAIIGREVTADNTSLEIDGRRVRLPKNIQVFISIYHLHRDEKIWGVNPTAFNPDNFLPHKVAERNAYEFIPFSKGSRNCIGWNYACYSMKIFLSHVFRNYKITTNFKYEDYTVNLNMFLEIATNPPLVFTPRE